MLAIRKGGHRDLERYYGLLEVDFDSEELLGKWNIHKAMSRGDVEFLIFEEDQRKMDFGYALVLHRGLYGYVLLKNFAVFPWMREHGLGIECMRLLNKRYAEKQGILAEITEFEDPDPDHLRKLLKFFARFGYVELNVNETVSGTASHLMVKPIRGSAEIDAIAPRVLKELYGRVLSPATMAKMLRVSAK